jgi:dTDP-D-glucose 4,6-dehydratase
MRILVTGGAGFIGRTTSGTLLTGGFSPSSATAVTVLDKLTYSGNRANLDPVAADARLTFVQGDICDASLVDELMRGHDAVVHFAAESHVDRSIAGAAAFVVTNVLGTQTLLDARPPHGSAGSCTCAPTRCTARSTRARGPRTGRCPPTRRTPPPRPARTCWPWPTTAPTGWTWW